MLQPLSSSMAINGSCRSRTGIRKRREGYGFLFCLACVSLFADRSTGFVNLIHPSTHKPPRQQLHLPQPSRQQFHLPQPSSSGILATSSSSPSLLELEGPSKNTKIKPQKQKQHFRLTHKEESDLLRRAVEYRRLNELEKDMALHKQNHLPLLSARAKAAGYGDEVDKYEDAKFEGQLARELLVTHNMGLVHYCINQIIGKDSGNEVTKINGRSSNNENAFKSKVLPLNSLSREDLAQEGAIGLARAVDKWNPDIGGKFSTYAVYWVRAAILRCIAERDDLVRVPNHISQAVVQINKAAKRLGWALQESGGIVVANNSASTSCCSCLKEADTAKRLAEEAGLSEQNFHAAMKARRRRYSGGYVSFEPWMQKTSSHHQQQHHKSDENEDNERKRLESSAATEELRMTLGKYLKPKELTALSWRYGLLREGEDSSLSNVPQESIVDRANRQFAEMEYELFGSAKETAATAIIKPTMKTKPVSKKTAIPPAKGRFGEAMSFTEVGKKMQVSAEYTRRLCHKALNKLQQAAEDGALEPAILC